MLRPNIFIFYFLILVSSISLCVYGESEILRSQAQTNLSRNKTQTNLPGGEQQQNPNSPEYKQLSEESLRKYLVTSGTTQEHKVIKIEKVTTQVVAGSLTRIDFIVAPTNDEKRTLSCHSEILEQSWLNKKDITVDCTPNQSRKRRQAVLGGQEEQDPNRPEYKQLAEESLRKYLVTSGTTQKHKVIKIKKVTTAVVSGSLTRIHFIAAPTNDERRTLSCHSEIWEQSWLNKKDITVNCTPKQSRKKRRETMVGGQTEQDPNSPEYQQLAEESLAKYLRQSGNTQHHKVIKIEKVTTQVVSGVITRIDFQVAPTNDKTRTLSCHSEILELPWRNIKDINVDCTSHRKHHHQSRNKRQTNLPGGEQQQNPNSPEYIQLAEESLKKYLVTSGTTQEHRVIKIEKVTTQVVAGSLTRIDFIVAPTNDEKRTLSCHSEILEQSWLNKKDITVNCSPKQSRKKREALFGGESEQDPNRPEYKQLAEESLRKYLVTSGTTQEHKVIKIEKVTTQVVSGSLTRIDFIVAPTNDERRTLSCHSKIWEQSWLNKKDITVNCAPKQSRKKRQAVLGGQEEQDPNGPEYKQLAEESLRKYLVDSGNTVEHKVIKIEKVTTAVVAGSLTRIDFIVAPTNDEKRTLSCHSEIWEQSWLNKKDITVNCTPKQSRKKRGETLVGGQTEQDPNSPEYQQLAEESLAKYLEQSGSTQHHKVIKIEKVTTQVVSGVITRIDFQVAPTNDKTRTLSCHSEILELPWRNIKDINVDCASHRNHHHQSRNKRQSNLPGGVQEQNPNSPEYKQLAEESLRKYLVTSGTTQEHRVIKIEKVTTQVVAGSLTRIDFIVAPTNDEKRTLSCHSKIWEQSWLNKKDITVNCTPKQSRKKRQAVLGGEEEQDPNRPEYKELAIESFAHYLVGTNPENTSIKVEKVTTQVVAGTVTRIDFRATLAETVAFSCHSEIFEQSWIKKRDISINCTPNQSRKKRETVVGGEEQQDPNRPEYKQLAEESLRKYLVTSGTTQEHKVIKIEKVTTQVVAGSLTRIDFIVAPTNDERRTLSCHSKIWEQSWLNKKDITVNCTPNQSRKKRQAVLGGEEEQDPNRPEYKQLAEESLRKYLVTSGTTQEHKVIKIEKVTTQVVSGSLTRIDFIVAPTNDERRTLSCHSKIWEQSWLNKKDITVNCTPNQSRKKRQAVLGGEEEQDPNRPEYKKLAIESLGRYLTGDLRKMSFKIEKVTTQVVAGTLTRIDFTATPTNDETRALSCHSEILEQSWIKKREISIDCTPNQSRKKRKTVVGGEEQQDPNRSEYKQLAEESLRKYLVSSGTTQQHKVIKIEKVTTQVVAGSLTRIDFKIAPTNDETRTLSCHSEILEQSWLNKKEITVNCAPDQSRNKRESKIRGGLKEQDPNDAEYKQLAEESLKKYLETSGTTQQHKVARVEKVTTQVVAGSLTRIDFIAARTNDETQTLSCHSEILEQPWVNKKEITVNCTPRPS